MEALPLVELPMASSHRGALSQACTQCAEGRKMVLFVSGLCRFRCFYCPVSPTRNQIDVAYANERRVTCDADVLEEAQAIGAAGTGITGGDPLGVVDRVEHYVRLLKGEFGPSHHIHLYTHEPNPEKLRRLAAAGLDEFRLHIPHYLWGGLSGSGGAYRRVLEEAPAWGLRRADRTAPVFAQTTPDGTIVLGVVEAGPQVDLGRWASRVVARIGARPGRYRLDRAARRVEVDATRLRRFAGRLRSPAFEVERYPTADALEVERAPLNAAARSRLGVGGGGT